MAASTTGTRERAIELLGQGIAPVIVAQSLGCSESFISQLLSEEDFLKQVVELRYSALKKHNDRDSAYDALEDSLLERLQQTMSYLMDPMKIARILQTVNAAKRRGQSTPDSITQQSTIVNLTIPSVIVNQFRVTKDVNNQIIEAGDQKLVTIQSGTLREKIAGIAARRILEKSDATTIESRDVTVKTA